PLNLSKPKCCFSESVRSNDMLLSVVFLVVAFYLLPLDFVPFNSPATFLEAVFFFDAVSAIYVIFCVCGDEDNYFCINNNHHFIIR
ncbi:MAG: hypothetical protein ACK49L_02920, partial [Bacteroidota bacterium]